jgi:tetratricopeptide (TPR) repeat protein
MPFLRRFGSQALILLVLLSVASIRAHADSILFNDGSVMVVEKAWIEGDEVKYKTSRGIQSIPKSTVREIQEQAPAPAAGPKIWGFAVEVGRSSSAATRPAPSPSNAGASDFSRDALGRLRDNLNAKPSDRQARVELIGALNSVASLQMSQGDLPGAKASLEEALNLDNRNVPIMSNLAFVEFRMGDYQATEDLLKNCLEIDDRQQEIYYLLGEAYYAEDKIDQAINQWRRGLQLGPNPEIAKRLDKAQQEQSVHRDLGELQGTHFILRYDRKVADQHLGEQILATLEKLYDQLTRQLTSRPPSTIAVILYPDQTYFDITRAASWSGALFDGKIRVPIKGLTSVTPQLTAVLTHELTHSFIASLPGRGCPTWFNEGLAQLEEGRSAANDRKALTQLRQSNRLIPLKNLEGSFLGLPADAAEVVYAEGLSAVEYLSSQYGKSAIHNILDLMAQNYNFDNAFQTALKRSVPEFENAWEQDLGR